MSQCVVSRLQIKIIKTAEVDVELVRRRTGMGIGVNAAGWAKKVLRDFLVELVGLNSVRTAQKSEAIGWHAVMHRALFSTHGAIAVAKS